MIPNSPPPPPDGDQTAVSGAGVAATPQPADLTDAGAQTDATIVRGAPSAPTVNDKPNDKPDANSFGKYELLGEIARGGMGVVYRARQHGLDRLVALKMVLGTGTDHEAAQRFLQEARAAAALDHPNVVPIYDTGEINGKPYFTMALIDGPNLRGHTDARGQLPIAEIVVLFAQIVEGVAHAHRHGIIHRDLKPANVLIDKDGRPRVTDFGLAKRAAVDSALTATGQVVGTPQYMAPEQARDSKDVGPPADVYSLGAILYFMLAGRPPFSGESFTDLLIKVVTDAPLPPRQARPDVPADLEELCLRCLAKQPADRFADAGALADALAPITVQYHTSTASRTSPVARIGLRAPSAGTVPDLSAVAASTPSLPKSGPALTNSAPSAVVPAAKASAVPFYALAGVVAAALIAVGVYFATRDKRPEVVKQDPPPVSPQNPNTGTPNTGTPKNDTPNAGTPTPGTNEGDKLTWPAPNRADFGLKFTMPRVEAKDKDGVIPVVVGESLVLHVTPDKECRVTVWLIEPNGHVMRVFPNEYDTDNLVKAGQTLVIGDKDTGKSELKASLTAGAFDRLRVIATTGDAPNYPPGVKLNEHTVYATENDRERLASTVRGIVIKKAGAPGAPSSVAEAELRFRAK